MSDTTYRVRVNYSVDTGDAERGVSRMSSGFESLRRTIMGAAAALGVSAFAQKIMELGSQAESTRIQLAGMMQAGGAAGMTNSAKDFGLAMGMSAEIVKKMRKDAVALPGEFEDLVNVFRGGLAGGLGAGKSVNEIEQLSATMMVVSKTLGVDSQTAGREFAMMMEGRAGAHNVLFQRLHNQIGKTGEEFNKLTQPEKWALIEKALEGYRPAVAAFASTWEAVESSTVDIGKNLMRVGTAPVFEMVKQHLSEWNDWFMKNQSQIEEIVKLWGTKLANALEKGFGAAKEAIGWIISHKDGLITIAEAFAMVKIGGMLGGSGMVGGMGGGGIGTNLGALFGSHYGAAGGQIGPGQAGTGFWGVQMKALERGGASLTQMIQGSAFSLALDAMGAKVQSGAQYLDSFNTVTSGVLGALGAIPGPLGLFANALNAAIKGLGFLANKLDDAQKSAISKDDDTNLIKQSARRYAASGIFGGKQSTMTDGLYTDTIAMLMRNNIMINGNVDENRLNEYTTGRGLTAGEGVSFMMLAKAAAERRRNKKATLNYNLAAPTAEEMAQDALAQRGKPVNMINITNNNHIVQTIENANDPSRVLVKTREALESIFRNPITTPINRLAVLR